MKKYALYGDDDQQRLNEIWEKEEDIQKMVDLSNHKILQERQKQSKKNKPYDTTVNSKKPEQVNDVDPAKPAVKKERFVKEEEKKKEKKKKEKTEKKKNKALATIIGIVIIGAIIGGVLWTFKPEVMSLVDKYVNKGTETSQIEKVSGEGYLTTAEDREYELKELLQQSKLSNDALQNYYTNLQDVVNAKSEDMKNMVNEMQTEVKKDAIKFQSYQKHFAKYEGGLEYYNTLQNRFNNLDNILNYLNYSQGTVADYVNQQIDIENQYIEESVQALKTFLDLNGISYTETDDKIEYKV